MLQQNITNGNTSARFFHVMQELKVAELLRRANIRKGCGVSAYEAFRFLLLLSFSHLNLFRYLASAHAEQAGASKNTFYRFMNNTSFNWRRFLLLLSVRVTSAMSRLTRKGRIRSLVLDDSPVPRNRSKSVELLARVFDHTVGHCIRGYNLLALGWTDGFSFIPVAFNLLTSPNKDNRYQEAKDGIDHRTVGYKTRMESMLHKPEAAFRLVQSALAAGIRAEYLLMDSWFTTEPFIGRIRDLGLEVIGMAKNGQQKYWFRGRLYTLGGLMHLVPSWNRKNAMALSASARATSASPCASSSYATATSAANASSCSARTARSVMRKSSASTATAGRSRYASRRRNPCSSWDASSRAAITGHLSAILPLSSPATSCWNG